MFSARKVPDARLLRGPVKMTPPVALFATVTTPDFTVKLTSWRRARRWLPSSSSPIRVIP
jgi:hypothetical protein